MDRTGRIAAAVGAAVVGGATWFYARELAAERARYVEVERDGAFSIRAYPPLVVAETLQPGDRGRALNNGFGLLADYIFAESREGEEIAMTAPVLAAPAEAGWRVRFVMPAALPRSSLPTPGAGVELTELPQRKVAALRFAGRANDAMLARKEAELRAWMEGRGQAAATPAEHAFYNSPMIPGPLRRNEVMIAI